MDQHFDKKHKNKLNFAEDSVCLSDYCDIMRCQVLVKKDISLSDTQSSTDIELYNEAAALATARKVVQSDEKSKLSNLPSLLQSKLKSFIVEKKSESSQQKEMKHKRKINYCNEHFKRVDKQLNKSDSEGHENENSTDNESNGPCIRDRKEHREFRMLSRSKNNCKTEEIHKLKNHCEKIVRTCSAASLAKLSVEEFKNMEGK